MSQDETIALPKQLLTLTSEASLKEEEKEQNVSGEPAEEIKLVIRDELGEEEKALASYLKEETYLSFQISAEKEQ